MSSQMRKETEMRSFSLLIADTVCIQSEGSPETLTKLSFDNVHNNQKSLIEAVVANNIRECRRLLETKEGMETIDVYLIKRAKSWNSTTMPC